MGQPDQEREAIQLGLGVRRDVQRVEEKGNRGARVVIFLI